MEVSMEAEDDLFFADLSKQIALLIMDDDEDDNFHVRYPLTSPQALSYECHTMTTTLMYEPNSNWMKKSKGTGVFIPQLSQPKRNYRQQRCSSCNNNNSNNKSFYKQRVETRRISHLINNGVLPSSFGEICGGCKYL